MKKDVSYFANFDPAFACDGLFVPRSQKGWALYDVGKEFDRGEIKFKGVQLTAAHQSVLLAVCARTGRHGLDVIGTKSDTRGLQGSLQIEERDRYDPTETEPETDDLGALLDMLFQDIEAGDAAKQNTASVEVSAYSLMTDAGLSDGGGGYKRMIDLLTDLSSVIVYRRVRKNGSTSRLISFKHNGDRMTILVNWRLAAAVLGGGQFARISLFERKDLKTAAAKILHAWLCCHMRPGSSFMGSQGVALDTLIPHVWGKRPAMHDTAIRKRRMALRDALSEIGALGGWAVTNARRHGIIHISRPKDPYAHEPVEQWLKTPGIFKDEIDG
jgi:hypothetical protein